MEELIKFLYEFLAAAIYEFFHIIFEKHFRTTPYRHSSAMDEAIKRLESAQAIGHSTASEKMAQIRGSRKQFFGFSFLLI